MDQESDWRLNLIDSLVEIDSQQAPHGLYGLRHALDKSGGSDVPPFRRVFARPEFEKIFAQKGIFKRRASDRPESFSFYLSNDERIHVTIWDRASTKVREFGAKFRYDSQSKKLAAQTPVKLDKFLPKLSDRSALLLIDHHAENKDSIEIPGKDFLERYGLCYFVEAWNDRYERQFNTTLHLWSPK